MKEFLRERRGALALTLVLGLGGSAVAGVSPAEAATHPKSHATASHEAQNSGITVHVQYFRNGTREIEFSGAFQSNVAGHNDYDDWPPNNIFEFCDGRDLVEETLSGDGNGDVPDGIARSVDYPGCADGKLTPSDFQLHTNATK